MLRSAINFLGLDRSILFLLLNRGFSAVQGLITVYFVTTYFSQEMQGYHYTLASLVTFQTMIELGFSSVLVQFINHEWAFLQLHNNRIEGEEKNIKNLAALLRLGLKWYVYVAIIFFIVVFIVGYLLLIQHPSDTNLTRPLFLVCFGTSTSLLFIPMRCFLEASNQIARAQRIILFGTMISVATGWISILLGANIYFVGIVALLTATFSLIFVYPSMAPFIEVMKRYPLEKFDDIRGLLKHQLKLGVSWIGGFFMYLAFVPILYYLKGPVEAGRMGTSMQIYQAVYLVGYAWTASIAPRLGVLGAKGEYVVIRSLVKHTLVRSLLMSSIAGIGAYSVYLALGYFHLPQAERFADPVSVAVIIGAAIVLQIPGIEMLTVRFQKVEPFLLNVLITAALIVSGSFIFGTLYSVAGVAAVFFGVTALFHTPWAHITYKKTLQNWISRENKN